MSLQRKQRFWSLLALLLALGFCVNGTSVYADNAAVLYPPNGLSLKTDLTTSGILTIEIENTEPPTLSETSHYTAAYQLAGASNTVPKLTVENAIYYDFKNGKLDGFITVDQQHHDQIKALVQIRKSGVYRQHQLYTLSIPIRNTRTEKNTGAPEVLYLKSMKLKIDIGQCPSLSPEELLKARSFAESVEPNAGLPEKSQLINPNIDPSFSVLKPADNIFNFDRYSEWSKLIKIALQGGKVYKYPIKQAGLYKVSAADLRTNENIRECRFFLEGKELNPYFIDRDHVLIQIPEFDNMQIGQQCLWAIIPPEELKTAYPPLRPVDPYTPPTRLVTDETTPSAVSQLVLSTPFERLNGYHPRLIPNSNVTRWYWDAVTTNKSTEFSFDLPKTFSPESETSITMQIYGQAPDPLSESARLSISVNGTFVINKTISASNKLSEISIPDNLLHAGSNKVVMRLYFHVEPVNKSDYLVQKLVFNWRQSLADPVAFAKDDLTFELPQKQTTFSTNRVDNEDLLMATTRQPFQIFKPLVTTETLLFDIGAKTNNSYRLYCDNYLSMPQPVQVNDFSQFDIDNGFDTIYIAPKSFRSVLSLLADHRAKQGSHILIVDTETVFDHFSYGIKSPDGIRSFLMWAFYRLPAPKLQNVLLVGEASDYKLPDHDLTNLDPMQDMLPVWNGPRSTSPRGDFEYSQLTGNDPIADICVGRIPVKTTDELSAVIEKIFAYENAPLGTWNLDSVFTYDDNDEFPKIINEVLKVGSVPFESIVKIPQADFYYLPNAKVTYRKRAYGATEHLLKTFDVGSAVMNFFGHGGPNLWTHERMLHLSDVASLSNAPRLPLVTCSSCDTAWIDYPIQPVQTSLGEKLITNPNGGAIGVFAPVSGASPYEHQNLMAQLSIALWKYNVKKLGQLAMVARNLYYVQTNTSSLIQQYVLLGDPALELNIPEPCYDEDVFSISPHVVTSDTTVTVTVKSKLDFSNLTRIHVTTNDGSLIKNVTFPRIPGQHEFELTLPPMPAGHHGVTLLQYGQQNELLRTYVSPITAETPYVTMHCIENGKPVDVVICEPDKETSVSLRIQNISSLPLSGTLQVSKTMTGTTLSELFHKDITLDPWTSQYLTFYLTVPTDGELLFYLALPDSQVSPDHSLNVPFLTKKRAGAPVIVLPTETGLINTLPENPDTKSLVKVRFPLVNIGDQDLTSCSLTITDENMKTLCTTETISRIRADEIIYRNIALNTPLHQGTNLLSVEIFTDSGMVSKVPLPIDVHKDAYPYILPGSIRLISQTGQYLTNETVFVYARVRNRGDQPISNVRVELLKGDPLNGTVRYTNNDKHLVAIPTLKPNETKSVLFRWEDCVANGSDDYYLILNRPANATEAIILPEDSWTTLPRFACQPLGDFKIDSVSVDPYFTRPGQPFAVNAKLSFDGLMSHKDINLGISLYNIATDEHAALASIPFSIEQPTTHAIVSKILYADINHPRVYVNVNADREIAESNPGNNAASLPLNLLLKSTDFSTTDPKVLSLTKHFKSFDSENAELVPGFGFQLRDIFTSSTGMIEVTQDLVSDGNIETSSALYHYDKEDSKWLVLPWIARAWPSENAGELTFHIPISTPDDIMLYEAKALVFASQNEGGKPSGSFLAKITSDSQYLRFDPSQTATVGKDSWITLGQTKLNNGYFNPTFKQVGDSTAYIKAFELKPLQATLTSPAIEFDQPESLQVEATFDFTQKDISMQYRCGAIVGKTINWAPWQNIEISDTINLPQDKLLLQIRILLTKSYESSNKFLENVILRNVTQ